MACGSAVCSCCCCVLFMCDSKGDGGEVSEVIVFKSVTFVMLCGNGCVFVSFCVSIDVDPIEPASWVFSALMQ